MKLGTEGSLKPFDSTLVIVRCSTQAFVPKCQAANNQTWFELNIDCLLSLSESNVYHPKLTLTVKEDVH
jgi:hypothetical protein